MGKLIIDFERCKSCSLCANACPKKLLKIDTARLNRKGYNPVILTDENACIRCAMCATMCPDCVITIED